MKIIGSSQLLKISDLEKASNTQAHDLGLWVDCEVNLKSSLYYQVWLYIEAAFDLKAYQPYLVEKSFTVNDYTQTYNPDNAIVLCPQFDIDEGQFGFCLYKGEGNMLLETTASQPIGRYIKAEGDTQYFGQQAVQSKYAVGFVTTPNEEGSRLCKGALFGKTVAISNTAST